MHARTHSGTRRTNLWRITAIVAAVAALIVGCSHASTPATSSSSSGSNSSDPKSFAGKTINVAVLDDYAPDYFRKDGELTGTNIDLVNAIAKELDVKVNWIVTSWTNVPPGLQTGKYDMSAASFSITPERRQILDFVSFSNVGTAFLAKAKSGISIENELELCGHSIGIGLGDYEQQVAEAVSAKCTDAGKAPMAISILPSDAECLTAVDSGRVELTATGYNVLAYQQEQAPDKYEVVKFQYEPAVQAFGFNNDSPWAPVILQGLKAVIANGTYDQIYKKWGVADIELATPELTT